MEVAVRRMRTRVTMIAAAAACAAGLAGVSVPAFGSTGHGGRPVLSVGGEVTSPSAYTSAQLAALPQVTVTVTAGGRQLTDTGVPVEALVASAGPAYPFLPNTKN